MGNLTSKLFLHDEEVNSKSKLPHQIKMGALEKSQEKLQCTPIMTRKELPADPRSATAGILRTPIEVDQTPTGVPKRVANAIPKYLQPKQYLETDIDSVVPALSSAQTILDPRSPNVPCTRTPIMVKPLQEYLTPVVKIEEAPAMDTPQMQFNKLDPRSPAADFDRTPILKPKSPKRNGPNAEQNNLMECTTEPPNTQLTYCETTTDFDISEIQVLPEIVSQQPLELRKRLDLDDEFNDSIDDFLFAKCSSDESDSDGQLTVIPNLKAMKTDEKLLSTHETINDELTNADKEIKTVKEDLEIITNISTLMNKKSKVDTEEKIRIWRDSISPDLFVESKPNKMISKSEEIVIEFDQDQSISKPEKTDNVLPEKINENIISKEPAIKKKKTAHKSKNSKRIISDKNSSNSTGGRAPLSNRSNSHKSEIPSKSPQQILRSKALSAKPYQQENTPPRSKHLNSKIKSSNAQWDLDKTVII